MHKILALFVAFISLFHGSTYTQVVNKAQMSIVRITGEIDVMTMFGPQHGRYSCTGEVIAPNRVLTAAHCVGETMLADGVGVKVLKVDQSTDLAVFEVKINRPALVLRDAPVTRFEQLSGIGYAWGLTRLSVLTERVFLTEIAPPEDSSPAPKILVQPGFIGGMSGGPMIDQDGLQVGVIQESGDGIGLGVSVTQIHAFLEGVN